MTAAIIPLLYALPQEGFSIPGFADQDGKVSTIIVTPWKAFACVAAGLWSGFIIGWITEVYTSNAYSPVQELAEACVIGAAPNIILGLALGYMSTIIPILCIGATIYLSFTFAGMYGIALAALGMLGCLPIALAIDGYGPISDNAGGIAEMSELHKSVREATDKLDAAGNTTAAIGKGFAIGSACLVALALFGAFVTRAQLKSVNILAPLEFAGLLIGAMLPYAFSALTMSAVGQAANEMIVEITRQFRSGLIQGEGEPDYERCIAISTKASLRKMIAPGVLVIGSPLLVGLLFGPRGVSGLLAGSIVSGVQIAISFSNTGGAWDNAKKYVESGVYSKVHKKKGSDEYEFLEKRTDAHRAAVVGDTVGDPLKDTSGPSINILIKLSAITSLVFGDFFRKTAYLV
jgi:H+-translocating diphosphatase